MFPRSPSPISPERIKNEVLVWCVEWVERPCCNGVPGRHDLFQIFRRAYDAGLCTTPLANDRVSGETIKAYLQAQGWNTGDESSTPRSRLVDYVRQLWDDWSYALDHYYRISIAQSAEGTIVAGE